MTTLTWASLFLVTLTLAFTYMLLLLLLFLQRALWENPLGKRLAMGLSSTLILFEPISILILLTTFILINPPVHGLLVGFLIFLLFYPLRNYFSGRILLLSNNLRKGQHIKVRENEGIIQSMKKFGLNLRTEEGHCFINYTTLLSDGFVVLKGIEVGGFYDFVVSPNKENEQPSHLAIKTHLEQKLLNCPYLDWSYKPDIQQVAGQEAQYMLRILLFEHTHLAHFEALVHEWGYVCSSK